MTDNTGNMYRTRQALTAGLFLIAIAVAILLYGLTDLNIVSIVGTLILLIGLGLTAMSVTYNGTPDKFGPSEKTYRMVAGTLCILAGAICILAGCGVGWFVYVAVLIIGIALIGMTTAVLNSKKTKY